MLERLVIALAATRNDLPQAAAYARKHWGEGAEYRALGTAEAETGGALVGLEIDMQFVQALRSRSVVRRMGASTTLLGWSKRLVRVTSGAVSYWLGEDEVVEASEPTLGNLSLDERKLVSFVPVDNSLLRHAPTMAQQAVGNDMILAAAAAEDLAFLRGDGAQHNPIGLRHQAADANVIASAGTTLDNVITDLEAAMAALEDASVPMLRPGWIMSPRSRRYLATLRWAADGGFAFRDELAAGTLFGHPYATTTGVPNNLGGGSDESEVYFADFSEVVVGDGQSRLTVRDGPAYIQSAVLKAAFSEDVSCARHIRTVDLNVRHDVAVSVVTGVQWGA